MIHLTSLPLATLALRAMRTVGQWSARARQRQELAALDDRLLRDIGLNRAGEYRDIEKWFWRP